jgi:hypothetical protein
MFNSKMSAQNMTTGCFIEPHRDASKLKINYFIVLIVRFGTVLPGLLHDTSLVKTAEDMKLTLGKTF